MSVCVLSPAPTGWSRPSVPFVLSPSHLISSSARRSSGDDDAGSPPPLPPFSRPYLTLFIGLPRTAEPLFASSSAVGRSPMRECRRDLLASCPISHLTFTPQLASTPSLSASSRISTSRRPRCLATRIGKLKRSRPDDVLFPSRRPDLYRCQLRLTRALARAFRFHSGPGALLWRSPVVGLWDDETGCPFSCSFALPQRRPFCDFPPESTQRGRLEH